MTLCPSLTDLKLPEEQAGLKFRFRDDLDNPSWFLRALLSLRRVILKGSRVSLDVRAEVRALDIESTERFLAWETVFSLDAISSLEDSSMRSQTDNPRGKDISSSSSTANQSPKRIKWSAIHFPFLFFGLDLL